MKHVARRIGFYLLALWAAVTAGFVMPRLMPGDPASALLLRFQGSAPPEAAKALVAALGFTDEPLPLAYLHYLGRILRGDLGISVSHFPATVSEVIGGGLGWSLLLAGSAVVFGFALGLLIGGLAAVWRGGWLDRIVPPSLLFLSAFPYFWLAMLLLYELGFRRNVFPLRHAYGDVEPAFSFAFAGSVLHHLVLPAGTVIAASLGGWVLGARNDMLGALGEEHVLLAEARGLPRWRVLLFYAGKSALLPALTSFGMALGFVVSGALLTEVVFSYPGLGYLMLQAVRSADHPLLQGLFLLITVAVLGANLLVDLLALALDPRLRSGR